MSGCPYSKFDFKIMEEMCEVTKELTHNAILCDFDFKDCPHYKGLIAKDSGLQNTPK